jgi:hypothetical protein
MATADTTEAAASLQLHQEINKIVLTATDELRNNTEKQPLQYAAIELAARRLHRYGDATIEAVDAITETALDCGLDPDEIQNRLGKGLTAAEQGAGRIYDFRPLDLHDLLGSACTRIEACHVGAANPISDFRNTTRPSL